MRTTTINCYSSVIAIHTEIFDDRSDSVADFTEIFEDRSDSVADFTVMVETVAMKISVD